MRTTAKQVKSNLEWLNFALQEQGHGLRYDLDYGGGGYRLIRSGTMSDESARMSATEMYYTLEAMSNMLSRIQHAKEASAPST
jgi:hypothetical protein